MTPLCVLAGPAAAERYKAEALRGTGVAHASLHLQGRRFQGAQVALLCGFAESAVLVGGSAAPTQVLL